MGRLACPSPGPGCAQPGCRDVDVDGVPSVTSLSGRVGTTEETAAPPALLTDERDD